MWILHLDVPSGVVVESRNEFYLVFTNYVPAGFPPAPLGKVSMPVFRELESAGKDQIHLGTDLSGNSSRANVGVYNASSETATAVIQLRNACDDAVVDSRTVSVPPNTVVQIGGLHSISSSCNVNGIRGWARYTIVNVSQPSITFVSNLNENVPEQQGAAGFAPAVGLAVTQNQRF